MRLARFISTLKDKLLTTPSLQNARDISLRGMLVAFAILGLPLVIIGSIEAFSQGHPASSLLYLALYVPVLLIAVRPRHFSYRAKSLILMGNLYILAFSNLLMYGFSGAGIHVLLTICVLVTLLLGWRVGIASIVLSLVSMGAAGYALSSGLVEIHPGRLQTSVSAIAWVTAGATILMLSGAMVVTAGLVQVFLQHSVEQLQKYQQHLEDVVEERRRAEERARHLLDRQIAVNQLALALGETRDLDTILEVVYEHVRMMVDAWAFVVSFFDAEAQLIRARYAVFKGTPMDVASFPPIPLGVPGKGTQSRVIRTGKTLYTPNHREAMESSKTEYIVEENGTITEGPPEEEDEDTAKSALYVPMKIEGATMGVMQLQSAQPDAYTQEDIDLLAGMANVAAVAVQNARLYGEVQQELEARERAEERIRRQLERLSALRDIDMAITASLDLHVPLKILLDQVTVQLGVDAAGVLLLNPHTQTLEYTARRGFRTAALQHTNLRLGEGYAGRAALERRTIVVPDLRTPDSDSDFGQSTIEVLRSKTQQEAFISYYGVPLIAKGEVQGVLEVFHRDQLDPDPEWLSFLETLAGQAAIAIDNATLFNDLQRSNVELALAYDTTLEGWARALELRDYETEGHSRSVTDLTLRLGRALSISDKQLVHVNRGALLHDIGKMGIPDSILLKPGPLTDEEWDTMRQHPVYAYEMLSRIAYLRPALDIPYCHHEKWDGTGYPRGLKSEQIPLAARIFAVVDVWDALCSDRPYRDAWPQEKALAHIREQAGKHFDPRVVNVFLDLVAVEQADGR